MLPPHRGAARAPPLLWHFVVAMSLAPFVAESKPVLTDKNPDCKGWATSGECARNPDFMNENCAASCAENPKDTIGEPEQCAGWADQGECTRNPKFMLSECPKNCKAQRAAVHEGLLDEKLECIDVATNASCAKDESLRQQCAGTCFTHSICGTEADPQECEKAMRCRELKDDYADCPDRVRKSGCFDASTASTLLKNCYLSCARLDTAGLLQRYRLKFTVRTRRHGMLDEDHVLWRRAGAPTQPLPCWKSTPFDPLPAATCETMRAQLLHRWRRLASPRCAVLKDTTPRAPTRRSVRVLPPALVPGAAMAKVGKGAGRDTLADAAAPPIKVLHIALSPKIRLVENFVTAEEAAHIIEIGLPQMHRSLAGGRTESIRTSSTGMLPAHDVVVKSVTERAALLTGCASAARAWGARSACSRMHAQQTDPRVPPPPARAPHTDPYDYIEPLQLVKYTEGQRYEPHFDFGEACDYEENLSNGHRHVTMLVYLNTVPEEYGGHTAFPKLGLQVSPLANSAIVFNDCLPNGQEDPRTLHGGSPPGNHTKIAINIWIRAQSMRRGFFG